MNEYVTFTEKCFDKYLKMIFGKEHDKKIAEAFINTYIDVRYSNYVDEPSKKVTLAKKLEKAFEDTTKQLVSESEPEQKELINNYCTFVSYFYGLDQLYILESQKKIITTIADKRKKLLNVEAGTFETEFNSELKKDIKKRKDFLDSFESPTFKLNIADFDEEYALCKLDDNITFPELYSDVAIKKAREKDIINENLTQILYLQITSKIVDDLIGCEFDKKYLVKLPSSFFDKKIKINSLFSLIDSPYVQDKLRLVVDFKSFAKYRGYVTEYMRQGFIFAVYLDESFDYSSDNIEFLELFEKILLHNDKYYYKDLKKNGKIKSRIISVDEVI
jgi:hypothetical protein